MYNLNSLYKPLTSNPFLSTQSHSEYPPCDPLKPFIACFWGSDGAISSTSHEGVPTLVIPDTCMDIIFDINLVTNEISSCFCGINDTPFMVESTGQTQSVSRFAIRFYYWAVHLFADNHLRGSCNITDDVDNYFIGWKNAFENMLISTALLRERIQLVQQFLLTKLDLNKGNTNLLNAVYHTLRGNGTEPIKEVCAYTSVSQRQLERLFLTHIGISIKKTASLVRYQKLWHDILYAPPFSVQDAVEKYKYTDQSHLLNEFTRYHNMTPIRAKKLALNLT